MHEMHGALSRYWFTRLDSGAVALLSSNICTQVDENSDGCTDVRFRIQQVRPVGRCTTRFLKAIVQLWAASESVHSFLCASEQHYPIKKFKP